MDKAKKVTDSCLKCGFCVNACPVYKEIKEETISPRAKIRLTKAYLNNEKVDPKALKKIMENCLMCESCFKNCPSGLHAAEAIADLRGEFKKKYGIDWKKKILNFVLSDINLRSMSAYWAGIVYNNFAKFSPVNVPLGALKLKGIPKLSKALKNRKAPSTNVKKALYFAGCLDRFLFSNTGESTIKLLEKLGYGVEVSRKEACCGIPLIISGDDRTILPNVRKNVALLTERHFDHIVTTCPTCAVALKEKYPEILKKYAPELLKKYNAVKDKVIDINRLLYLNREKLGDLKGKDTSVTYHDPCHLVNSLGISKEPRELLKSVKGVKYIEMKDAATCCGSGGFYHVYFPEISKKIGNKKTENIKDSGADIVVTACPACKLQLINHLNNAKIQKRVMHIAEFLSECSESQ